MSERDPPSERRDPDDIDAWLEGLAGRADSDPADEITPRLRTALKVREATHQGERQGLEALQARLEREGLITPPFRRRWARFKAPLAAAATLAGVGVLIGIWWQGQTPTDPVPSETVRFRGLGVEVPVVTAEPARWIEETEEALEQAGCAATRPSETALVLVVDAAAPCLAPLNQQLDEGTAPITEPGRYRLVIEASP